jgi:hypothetical protein
MGRRLSALTLRRLACGLVAATAMACDTGPTACPQWFLPAIEVEIRDARTGSAIAWDARGVVRDGAYVDSLYPYKSMGLDLSVGLYSRAAADERPGTYSVEVVHPSYQTWTASGVTARRGKCNVETHVLRANMQPK